MAEFKEVIKRRYEMCNYYASCGQCPLAGLTCHVYALEELDKIEKIVMNWEKSVDWSTVAVDTKILVRNNEDCNWERRYFAKYENGKVYAFGDGSTSWTTKVAFEWDYAKLWEGAEE